MTLAAVESNAPLVQQPDDLPRGSHMKVRAMQAVAAVLRERDLPVGTVTGEQARQACRDHLLPAVEEVLRARIQACRPDLIAHTLRCLSAAHATRHVEQLNSARSLAGPFADNWIEHALRAQEGAAATRPLEVLFEFILAQSPGGRRPVDTLEVADLAALAELLLTTATRTRGADQNLHELTIHIAKSGVFAFDDDITSTDIAGLGFNQQAYSRAQREQHVALARTMSPQDQAPPRQMPIDATSRSPMSFTPLRSVADTKLLHVDELLRDASGTGLDAVRAVLNVARDWPVGESGFEPVEPGEMAAQVVAWSGLPAAEVAAAIAALQLTGEDLASLRGEEVAELEGRAHRLALRPLPVVDGQLLIVPWLAHAALGVHISYLSDSRLPYPREKLPDRVENVMQQRRQRQNDQLEEDVRAVVRELGLAHQFRFGRGDAATAGIAGLPGEVDLLIADAEHGRLWVCEVKDPQAAHSPLAIVRHIRLFTQERGHIDKLTNKVEVISNSPAAAAEACGITSSGPWRVVPLIVTRWVEPAAFVANPRVAFTVPDCLASVLSADSDPALGPGDSHFRCT
jgi:hypothetical protein